VASGNADAMSLRVHSEDASVHIYACGELDFTCAGRLTQAVDAAKTTPGHRIVLDLTGLTFCDAGGVTALLQAHRVAQDAGAPMGHEGVPGAGGERRPPHRLRLRLLLIEDLEVLVDHVP